MCKSRECLCSGLAALLPFRSIGSHMHTLNKKRERLRVQDGTMQGWKGLREKAHCSPDEECGKEKHTQSTSRLLEP